MPDSVVRRHILRRRARRRQFLWTGAELLVTAGVLGLLLVVHQLWWTNREAREGAEREVRTLERQWGSEGPGGGGSLEAGPAQDTGISGNSPSGDGASSRTPAPRRSQAYAVLVLPRIGVRVPIAEGIDKRDVLDKGYAGHYPGTQQPGAQGNFALAAHRNTHGEPFRRLDRLRRGDTVRVETATTRYTYTVDRVLPQTSARDSGVLRAVPRSTVHPGYGYDIPAAYLTLTTCTPEYTSRYRLVVWGKLVSSESRN